MIQHPVETHPYITTYTGEKINFRDFRPEQVHLEDIAHSLALTCRFVGHVQRFYSVAEHSMLVRDLAILQTPSDQDIGRLMKHCLLHDATEAYIGDFSSPLKHYCHALGELETHVKAVIVKRFDLEPDPLALIWRQVKECDIQAVQIEASYLLSPSPSWAKLPELDCFPIPAGYDPVRAEERFIHACAQLPRSLQPL